MIMPDNIDDATLEYAAQIIEGGSMLDYLGVMAGKKRDRENAELRLKARKELRAEMARRLRSMINRPDLRAENVLRAIIEAPEKSQILMLRDAWPLAWKGWLTIEAIIVCNDNSIPPETSYRIKLTEKGEAILASATSVEAVNE